MVRSHTRVISHALGSHPAYDGYMLPPTASAPNGISKDFLRQVCEPFFEQMLVAVHQAVACQAIHAQGQCQSDQVGPQSMQQQYQPEPSTEDGSEASASESAAFSAVFSSPSEERRTHVLACMPENMEPHSSQELQSELGSDEHEKNVMVCRHWKSKGWCRMKDECKFLHPGHKRGVGFANCDNADVMNGVRGNNAEICYSFEPSNIQSGEFPPISVDDGKKKAAKKRKNKGKPGILMAPEAIAGQTFGLPFVGYAGNASFVPFAVNS